MVISASNEVRQVLHPSSNIVYSYCCFCPLSTCNNHLFIELYRTGISEIYTFIVSVDPNFNFTLVKVEFGAVYGAL